MEHRPVSRRSPPPRLEHRPTKAGLLAGMLLCLVFGGFGGAAIQRSMTPAPKPAPVERQAPARKAELPVPTAAASAPLPEVAPFEVQRDTVSSNLFVVRIQGEPKGSEVDFAIDTGAEITVLREQDAKALGAVPTDMHDREIIVIGSVMPLKGATVPRMRVAGVEFSDVEVLIGPDTLPFSLLGQKEIARLGSVEFDGDVMRIRPSRSEESLD